jgi:hypothetical protein
MMNKYVFVIRHSSCVICIMPYLSLTLLISAALFSGLTVLFILLTIRSRREHKNTIFPVVRETEGIKAKRFAIVSGVFLVLSALSIGGWIATQQDPQNILIAKEATQQAALQQTGAIVTPAPSPSSTVAPVRQVISKSQIMQEQASPTVFAKTPTSAPTAANATATSTPKTAPVPAPDGVSMGPITFSASVNDKREAENPTDIFDVKTKKVYAAFPYRGMKNGAPFSVIWYYQNSEIVRDDFEWDWGSRGQSYFFVKLRNAGVYKVEFKINNEIIAEGRFKVTP